MTLSGLENYGVFSSAVLEDSQLPPSFHSIMRSPTGTNLFFHIDILIYIYIHPYTVVVIYAMIVLVTGFFARVFSLMGFFTAC